MFNFSTILKSCPMRFPIHHDIEHESATMTGGISTHNIHKMGMNRLEIMDDDDTPFWGLLGRLSSCSPFAFRVSSRWRRRI